MPTSTLLIIAEVTLLFDQSKMEVAIGLSLTVMLVMYTLYQSIMEAVTKTAYLKMLDYWLLFCLLMPFITFLIEIYWFLRKHNKIQDTYFSTLTKKFSLTKRTSRKLPIILTYCITILFSILYFFAALLMFHDVI